MMFSEIHSNESHMCYRWQATRKEKGKKGQAVRLRFAGALARDDKMRRHMSIRRIGCKGVCEARDRVDVHHSDAIEKEAGSWKPVFADEAACTKCNPLFAEAEERGIRPDGWTYGQLVNYVFVCFNGESRHGASELGGQWIMERLRDMAALHHIKFIDGTSE